MATTFVDYTGDGNATKAFSFPSYKVEDIKVEVDNVIKTVSTHYNITSYTTTGGGNVVFTSGNIPSSPAAIRIFRDTDVDTAKATYTAGSAVKADDLNNNHTQLLYAAQEEQNQTILTSDIKDGAVTTAKIKADNITSALIADDQINSEHYVDGSIDTAHIADGQITTVKIAFENVTSDKIAANAITAAKIADNAVQTAHIADANVTTAKLADNSVTSAKIASNAVTTSEIVDNAITTAKIGNTQITTAKIADGNVTTDKIAFENVASDKIAANAVTAAKIASNAVTTDKIADSELTTLAGMQSGTASKLADSTALTADIADLNQIDGMAKQTTITDDDTKFPTSGAVVDYVAAQLEPFGGFEAIANEVSFPNTQPASGVAISIADAAGIVVDGSNSSTTGRTVGGTTVTINNINSQFTSSTVASGIRFIVTSTGSGHVYNYHKSTLPESDLVNLSGDINDFNERYRVGSSNPTSSLDGGDLFFNTSTGKLLVYNSTNSAWEEAQSIGNFFISTLSPAFDGTTQDFTLTNAPANAQQVLLSINGVVQKPNAGSSAPSEGFALTGSTVKLSAAPATGSTYHAVVMGSTVNIGTPSDNTVTTAILQNGSVTTAKITDANVTTAKIADDAVTSAKIATNAVGSSEIQDGNVIAAKLATGAVQTAKIADNAVTAAKLSINAGEINGSTIADDTINSNHYVNGSIDTAHIADLQVTTAKIADQAVTLAKLPHGDGSSDGKFLRANNGADPTFESIPPAAITAIANTGANRVITDDGDGTVTAESSLNFTGDRLLVNTSTPDPYGNRSLTVAAGTSGGNTTTAIEVRSPTNGDGRIIFTDSTSSSDTGSYKGQIMYDQSNDFMQFSVNGAQEAMRIDGNKNLLVGTTSFNNGNFTGSGQGITVGGTAPQITLHRTDNDKDAFFGNNGTNAYLFTADSMPIVFGTGDAERMRISATGKVGMGGSPATSSTLRVFQPTATDYDAATAANNPAIIISAASGGGADGKCVGLSFNGPNANGEANFAMVGDGSNECNFHLSMRSGGTRKDVLKIEPVGKFQIGVSNSPSHAGVSIAASDYPSFRLWDDQMSDNFVIRYENSTQRVQFINNHNGAYLSRGGTGLSSYSDERLKTIVSNITGGFEKIKGLRTVIGHYNDDPDKYQKPFLIAQDVQAVLPEAVSTREPDKLTLCYTEVIPFLTNALQEAIAKIETLETKVTALEAA